MRDIDIVHEYEEKHIIPDNPDAERICENCRNFAMQLGLIFNKDGELTATPVCMMFPTNKHVELTGSCKYFLHKGRYDDED